MCLLTVRVTTRSAKPGIGEWKVDPGDRPYLEVRVSAAPADGAANEALVKLLAKTLDVPRGSILIHSGETSRLKRIDVPLDEAEMRARLSR